MAGFGPVPKDERVFHDDWERRVFGLSSASRLANIDAFRHAIERLDPVTYLTAGYYGRWLGALELLAHEQNAGVLPTAPTSRREVNRAPRFTPRQKVVTRSLPVSGHTRLPRYARGRCGVVERVHPAFVLPDTNAHGRGEHPEHVYCVGFDATDLWGETAEPGTRVHLDLFESYLSPDKESHE
jgi:nitrile hydratase